MNILVSTLNLRGACDSSMAGENGRSRQSLLATCLCNVNRPSLDKKGRENQKKDRKKAKKRKKDWK